ncbi:GNAT family N-acetyltransferase [Thalassobium sp. R2A62]|uniref:GNAT family N-acetyltransferase n=1 Tax=Thalassobium sp. R2A62 TaxID=633131 RepID=UPI0001B1CA1E|nr:GNAT family N-acyltransferase [Thalassobium sp. R2A62]EET46954.1 phospholipid/glycerol acyltransferase [Thalassobium sp. R2A62]
MSLGLSVRLAATPADVEAAQRLRYRVFVQELGATGSDVDHARQLECDTFDALAEHLILVDDRRDVGDHVVGVYRLLSGAAAAKIGRFYTEIEYDLSRLKNSGRKLLELGRSCMHPDFRGGKGFLQLWAGLADYIDQNGFEIIFGVASFHGTDIESLCEPLAHLHHTHRAAPELRVRARPESYVPLDQLEAPLVNDKRAMIGTPALIKAYLKLGGRIGDGAFVDHQFNTVDVCVVIDVNDMNQRQKRIYTRGFAA